MQFEFDMIWDWLQIAVDFKTLNCLNESKLCGMECYNLKFIKANQSNDWLTYLTIFGRGQNFHEKCKRIR